MTKKIRSVTVYRVEKGSGGKGSDQSGKAIQSFTLYNEEGNILEEVQYGSQLEMSEKNRYLYDDKGRVSGMMLIDEANDVLEDKRIEWSDADRMEREVTRYLDGSEMTVSYHYDDQGRLIRRITADEDGEVEGREIYHYEGDNLVKVEKYNEDDRLIYKQEDIYIGKERSESMIFLMEDPDDKVVRVIKYNDRGQRSAEMVYDRKDRLIEKNLYEVDDQGRLVKMVEENATRKNITEFLYDDSGNNIKEQVETDRDGNLNHRVLRTYDADGNQLETRVIMPIGNTDETREYSIIFEYEYY